MTSNTVRIYTLGLTKKSINNFRTLQPNNVANVHELYDLIKYSCKKVSYFASSWVKNYVKSPKRNQFLVIALDKRMHVFVGAAGCTIRSKVLYLDFICSGKPKLGTRMMTFIRRIAKRLGKEGVELVSVPEYVGFYRKQGYRRGPLGANKRQRAAAAQLFGSFGNFLNTPTNKVNKQYFNYLVNAAYQPEMFGGHLFKNNENEVSYRLPKYSRRVAKRKYPMPNST
jgi:hypothetical protein